MGDSYERALQDEARDLVAAACGNTLAPTSFRDDEIAQCIAHLDHGRSVLLLGAAGAGKTAVVHGVAQRFAARGRGAMRQLSTATVMSGTRYIGEWQTKISRILEDAESTGTVVYFSDIWNMATVGKTSRDPACLLDAVRPFLEAGRVQLIGETNAEVMRSMQRVPGFVHLFHQVAVAPLDAASVDAVLDQAAQREGLTVDRACRRTLVQLTTRFLPSRPQPGPALDLLRQAVDYRAQKLSVGEDVAFESVYVERVFSIYSGLPMFVVSRTETMPARDIRAWFSERIVGQAEALEAVVETIALFKAGLHDPGRPLGTFLFVGPTGVGKTEVARAVATFLFGSDSRMLRFDLSEFKDFHSFEMLVGNAQDADKPARLVDPVRAQPFQVVLLDELEKAHTNVWDLFLQLLDEGRLTPPGGQPVDFRNTIIIATSNVGSKDSDRSVGFGAVTNGASRTDAIRRALEEQFRPEFLNRFQHVVVFHPLTAEQVRRIARQELRRILQREGITARNLVVDVNDEALDLVIDKGFDPRYGARALKREIQRQIVLPLAMMLMERTVEPGSILKVVPKNGHVRVRLIETPESRATRREREPIKTAEGRKLTKVEITAGVATQRERIMALCRDVDEDFLVAERDRLVVLRREPEFWNFPDQAALALRDLDRYGAWLTRLDRLRTRADEIDAALARADMRREVEQLANRMTQLGESVTVTRRELVVMGTDGMWDALVEVRPLGASGRVARDYLVGVYRRWAEARRMKIEWLRDPIADDEPALLSLQGHYAFGFLRAEAGLHRLREDEDKSVACVRVAAWTDRPGDAEVVAHRALKTRGQLAGKVRSRVECAGGLVLQNARPLAVNRELAADLGPSWAAAPLPPDDIVRRYDLSPFMLRDVLTGVSTGRVDVLEPRAFHQLLCQRVDAVSASRSSS